MVFVYFFLCPEDTQARVLAETMSTEAEMDYEYCHNYHIQKLEVRKEAIK